MKTIIKYADEFLKMADWKDIALLKLCLAAVGLGIGLSVKEEKKRPWIVVSVVLFLAAYVPLMMKFVPIFLKPKRECGMYAGAHDESYEEGI